MFVLDKKHMGRRKLFVTIGVTLTALACITGCNSPNRSPVVAENDLVTFVPVDYEFEDDLSFSGDVRGLTFNNNIAFRDDNIIRVDFALTVEGETIGDSFSYNCTQEQIDKIQAACQFAPRQSKEDQDSIYCGLTYVLLCFYQGEINKADTTLSHVYDLAVADM